MWSEDRRVAVYGLAGPRAHAHCPVGHSGVFTRCETRFAKMAQGLLAGGRRSRHAGTMASYSRTVSRRFKADARFDRRPETGSRGTHPARFRADAAARSAAAGRSQFEPPGRADRVGAAIEIRSVFADNPVAIAPRF